MTTMRPEVPSSSFSPGGAFTTWSGTTGCRGGDDDGPGSLVAPVEKDVELPEVACSSPPSSSPLAALRLFSSSLWTDSL